MQQRPALKRKRSYFNQPYQAKRPLLLRQNASLINPVNYTSIKNEKKNLDQLDIAVALPITATGFTAFTCLNVCGTGTSPTTRVGRKIRMKSLTLRYNATASAGMAIQARILIIYDKQNSNSAAGPALTDILTGTPTINSLQNLSNNERFVVIADEYTDSTQSANAPVSGKIYRKLNLDAVFDATVAAPGTIQAISTGSILVLFAQNSAQASTITFSSRIRFEDS